MRIKTQRFSAANGFRNTYTAYSFFAGMAIMAGSLIAFSY